MAEQDRLKNEMDLAYNLYNTCAQQVQMAKAKVQQETPVCVVVEPPTLPTQPSKPSKMLTLVAFVFLGACLSAVWVLFGKGLGGGPEVRPQDGEDGRPCNSWGRNSPWKRTYASRAPESTILRTSHWKYPVESSSS